MASTKQMQQRAKERNKIMQLAQTLDAEVQKFNHLIDTVGADVEIKLIGYEKGNYWNRQWSDDYNKTDKGNCILQTKDKKGLKNYEIEYRGQAVGWFNLRKLTTLTPGKGREVMSELGAIYISPDYRSLGLATLAYIYAMNDLGCNLIELTYERALGRIHYWQALGFKSVQARFGQNGSRKALAMLMTKTDRGYPLNKSNINRIREMTENMDWAAEAKKIGVPIDKIYK